MAFSSRYDLREKLGEGGQAAVYRAVRRSEELSTHHPSREVAVKVYPKLGGALEDLSTEVKLLRQLRHRHIVAILDVVHDAMGVYKVQELLEGGELFDFLLARGALQESVALETFAQVVLAVDYLHSLSVAHRDIKTDDTQRMVCAGVEIYSYFCFKANRCVQNNREARTVT